MKNTGRSNAKARILCAASALALLLLAAAAFSACRAESRTADADAEHEGRTLDLRAEALPEIEWLLEQATRYDCIDLRGHDEITSGEIARLRQENPACEILWSVPLGSGRYDTTLTHITCSDITAEEIALLDAFPKLALLDGRGSACYRELCAYQAAHPDCEVLWTVPIAGVEADSDIEWLSLGGQTPERHGELLELLAYLPKLTDVDLVGTTLSTSEKAALRQKYPELRFYWTIDFPERQFRSTDERLDFTTVYFRDIEELAETVRCFLHPTWVDVSTLGFENVEMETLLAEFPDTKFVWIVRVGKYTLRTDVTIFNGESHSGDRLLRDADIVPLKYCTELEAVNLTRHKLTDLSPLAGLTKLRVLVISKNDIADITPLSTLRSLTYLEAYSNAIQDAEALAALPDLIDLNLMDNAIENETALAKMRQLERLWVSKNPLAKDDAARERLLAALPETAVECSETRLKYGWTNHARTKAVQAMWSTNHANTIEENGAENGED